MNLLNVQTDSERFHAENKKTRELHSSGLFKGQMLYHNFLLSLLEVFGQGFGNVHTAVLSAGTAYCHGKITPV